MLQVLTTAGAMALQGIFYSAVVPLAHAIFGPNLWCEAVLDPEFGAELFELMLPCDPALAQTKESVGESLLGPVDIHLEAMSAATRFQHAV